MSSLKSRTHKAIGITLVLLGVAGFTLDTLATNLAALANFSFDRQDLAAYLTWRIGAALGSIALIISGLYLRSRTLRHYARPASEPAETELADATRTYLKLTWRAFSARLFTASQAVDFVEALLSPDKYRLRTSESISLDGERVKRSCSIHFGKSIHFGAPPRHPGRESIPPFLPIARFKRGHLLNDVSLTDAGGRQVAPLPNRDYMTLVGVCVVHLANAALLIKPRRQVPAVYAMLLGQCLVSRPLTRGESLDDRMGWHEAHIRALPEARIRDCATFHLLCGLLAIAETTYALVVRQNSAAGWPHYVLSYNERLQHLPDPYESQKGRRVEKDARGIVRERGKWPPVAYHAAKTNLRTILGVDPPEILIDVSRAKKSHSYHIEVSAPDGMHVRATHFYDRLSGVRVPSPPSRNVYRFDKPYFRCPAPSGSPTSHLYTREFTAASYVKEPALRVSFGETPPGSVGRAWLISLSLLIIIWVIGSSPTYASVAGSTQAMAGTVASSSLSSLLFTVPIALIGLLGLTSRDRDAKSLTGQASLILSSLLALASLTVDQLLRGGRITNLPSWPSVAMVTNPFWICLLLAATAQTLALGTRALRRFFSWRALLKSEENPQLPR